MKNENYMWERDTHIATCAPNWTPNPNYSTKMTHISLSLISHSKSLQPNDMAQSNKTSSGTRVNKQKFQGHDRPSKFPPFNSHSHLSLSLTHTLFISQNNQISVFISLFHSFLETLSSRVRVFHFRINGTSTKKISSRR
jgi:hypothetical protein